MSVFLRFSIFFCRETIHVMFFTMRCYVGASLQRASNKRSGQIRGKTGLQIFWYYNIIILEYYKTIMFWYYNITKYQFLFDKERWKIADVCLKHIQNDLMFIKFIGLRMLLAQRFSEKQDLYFGCIFDEQILIFGYKSM